ncbi:Smr/MutS family protein [Xanthobacter autotrophicus]|uniref:Smr/MutS family protein n=1 Tax=Xanthobacter autotrophicus TaxID=280 RepID=UPI0024A6DAD7|nr:Smr/MutS family protein [Xanthobacter autotrophicus]MDI4658371.1 Smr/MutS family protein [Xanthobacter autotrophicus]
MSRRGRRRQLSAEERALWDHVVRSVTPLKLPAVPEDVAPLVPEPAPVVPEPPPVAPPKPTKASRSKTPPAPPPAPPLASLEPKTRRRLIRGAEVDARLDLHGLTQAAAHRRLRLFLIEAQALGHALVLVITGKGDPDRLMSTGPAFGEGRGVLKRAVPLWLAEPDLRMIVVGFESAGRRHGGEGALYVRIRRRKA